MGKVFLVIPYAAQPRAGIFPLIRSRSRQLRAECTRSMNPVRAPDGARRIMSFMERAYYVYIMCSLSRCLYVGVTNDLVRRVGEHRGLLPWCGVRDSFTRHYNTRRLVFLEVTTDVRAAIAREKQIKSWSRARKLKLIQRLNPGWDDLAARWPDISMPGW